MRLVAATYDADGYVTKYVVFDDDSPDEGIEPILRAKRRARADAPMPALRDAQQAADAADAALNAELEAPVDPEDDEREARLEALYAAFFDRQAALRTAQEAINTARAEADAMAMTAREAAAIFMADHPDYVLEEDTTGGNPGHRRRVEGKVRIEPRPQPVPPLTAGEVLSRMSAAEMTALVDVLEQRGAVSAERKAEITRGR